MAKPAETRTTAAGGGAKTGTTGARAPESSGPKGAAPSSTGGKSKPAAKGAAVTAKGATSKSAAKGAAAKDGGKSASRGAAAKSGTGKGAGKGPAAKSPAKAVGKAAEAPSRGRSVEEIGRIREALGDRREELREEYEQHLAEIAELQRDRLTDSAGDDQADTGSKTFEREQEISLANSILERITQVERALERLDEGTYGWCERCGDPIPVERLAAFPSATLCVRCKQLEERR